MARYCPPIRGTWQPENGACLRFDYGDAGGYLFETLCCQHGIPCASKFGDPPPAVPIAVADLVDRAVALASQPARAEPLWAEAKRLLAEAEASMLAADVAVAETQFIKAA